MNTEYILAHEAHLIYEIQRFFKHRDTVLLFFSHFGDPKLIIFIYFAILYSLNKSAGVYIIWLTVFADWTNFMIKWVLRSPRPYWWVHATNYYVQASNVFPHLKHFPITCETGPGNPSGHMMVATCVYVGLLYFALNQLKVLGTNVNKRRSLIHNFIIVVLFGSLTILLTGIGLSRLYIAAHFPHQIFFGMVGGLAAWYTATFVLTKPRLLTCALVPITGLALYTALHWAGLSPDNSIRMAYKYCALRAFVNFNTTPFVTLARSVGTLMGLALTQSLAFCYSSGYVRKHQLGKSSEIYPMKNCLRRHVSRANNIINQLEPNPDTLDTPSLINHKTKNFHAFIHQHNNMLECILRVTFSLFLGVYAYNIPYPILPTENGWKFYIYLYTFTKFALFTSLVSGPIPYMARWITTLKIF